MVTGIRTAWSALNGFSTKLAVAADNVANASTDGFKKKRATLQEAANGGVTVSIQEIQRIVDLPPGNSPSNPNDKEASNVDVAEETIHIMLAKEGFEANLRCLQAHDEIRRTVLDIIG